MEGDEAKKVNVVEIAITNIQEALQYLLTLQLDFFVVDLSPVFDPEIVSDAGQNPLSRPIRRRRKRRKDR